MALRMANTQADHGEPPQGGIRTLDCIGKAHPYVIPMWPGPRSHSTRHRSHSTR